MMRNRFHFISLAVVLLFGLETVAAADTFRIRLTGARCADDPACHNRFHPAIKPVITVKPGDTVIMETREHSHSWGAFARAYGRRLVKSLRGAGRA